MIENLTYTHNGLKYTNLETLKTILCPTCNKPHNPKYAVERLGLKQYCFTCEQYFYMDPADALPQTQA